MATTTGGHRGEMLAHIRTAAATTGRVAVLPPLHVVGHCLGPGGEMWDGWWWYWVGGRVRVPRRVVVW